MNEEQTFEPGDRIQYNRSNKNILLPIGTVKYVIYKKGIHHQKIIVQFGDEKPRQVYANDYRIIGEKKE